MNILMVIPALGNVYGGPSKIVVELAESIGKLGVGVDIVTTNANGSQVLDFPVFTWIKEKHYRVQYFPYLNFLDYKLSWSLTKWLFQHVADYDIVHTNALFSYPVLPAHLFSKINRVPYIMTPHGMLEPWALAYKAGKKKIYFTLFEKPALKNASAIQMTASVEARQIKEMHLKTPLVFVPNGLHRQDFETTPDIELFYQKFPHTRNKKLIIFLGRIDPKKGLDLLANAFAKVNKQFVETHLIVAGPDNIGFLPTVESYFSKAGCIDAVTFTGMLTGDIKYAALAAASIYVAPSYSEGFSMSVLEGMATGLPCVITTGCNFPEAGNAGAAYEVHIDVNAIANALIDCLSNPEKAKAMGSRARQLIFEQYTWERIATKMIEVYANIINKSSVYSFNKITTQL